MNTLKASNETIIYAQHGRASTPQPTFYMLARWMLWIKLPYGFVWK